MKNILELTSEEVKSFFLKQESYCTINFPVYFNFQELLDKVDNKLKGKILSNFYGSIFDEKKTEKHINKAI